MIYVGYQVPKDVPFAAIGAQIIEYGADTFAFFTRHPKDSRHPSFTAEEAAAFYRLQQDKGLGKIVAHAPYTMNLCFDGERPRQLAWQQLARDLAVMEEMPGNYYNLHPGYHMGQGEEAAIEIIADALNANLTEDQSTVVLLETMAGGGARIGSSFEELAAIYERVRLKDKIGFCLDTCHMFDSGYDLVTDGPGVLAEFDRICGLDKVKAIHLNDSSNACGSRMDVHFELGKGKIGKEPLQFFAKHPAFQGLPFIIESPDTGFNFPLEIARLKDWTMEST